MKDKIFLDFDSTIVNTIQAFCDVYNQIGNIACLKDFVPAKAELVNQWDFKDQCPLIDNPMIIFNSQLFFNELQFMPNAKEVIELLSKQYDIIICSIGTYKNISLKSLWIQKHLPFIQNTILLINNNCKMDKSIINMKSDKYNTIFIDDHENNLLSSNANLRFCFGKQYPWNTKWIENNGLRLKDWIEVNTLLRN